MGIALPVDFEADEIKYRRRKSKSRGKNKKQSNNTGLTLQEVSPKTSTQRIVFYEYKAKQNLLLTGCAGTGKTFLSMYLSLDEVFSSDHYDGIIIVRSAVPSRDVGFLSGNLTEKSKIYETPYRKITADLFGRDDAYDILKAKGIINFITTSYVRGETWDNKIVLVDEIQNMDFNELNSIITRVGEGSRIIFCGDSKQDDLTSARYKTSSGINLFVEVLDKMKSFSSISFGVDDIIRSGLVREYLRVCYNMGI